MSVLARSLNAKPKGAAAKRVRVLISCRIMVTAVPSRRKSEYVAAVNRMSLPPDAGAAVAAWLRDRRPQDTLDRHVFTRLIPPRRAEIHRDIGYHAA
jgi:hypothetical protein